MLMGGCGAKRYAALRCAALASLCLSLARQVAIWQGGPGNSPLLFRVLSSCLTSTVDITEPCLPSHLFLLFPRSLAFGSLCLLPCPADTSSLSPLLPPLFHSALPTPLSAVPPQLLLQTTQRCAPSTASPDNSPDVHKLRWLAVSYMRLCSLLCNCCS